MDLVPSWELIVFWRETGTYDDEDEVDARDDGCSMATDMTERMVERCGSLAFGVGRRGSTN